MEASVYLSFKRRLFWCFAKHYALFLTGKNFSLILELEKASELKFD